jgi:hypothetical protein
LSQRISLGQTIPTKAHQMTTVKLMNLYVETIMTMAHQGVDSEIKHRSDNTKKAHQITTVKLLNKYIKTIMNMVHNAVETEIHIRSDNTKKARQMK